MAIDIIARGLATSIIGSDGKIAADKMPVMGAGPASGVFTPVGSLKDASQIEGKTAEEILMMMLFGIVSPTLTNPSFKATLDSTAILIAGRAQTVTGKLTFNRGKIDPAYGTSGYRSGAPSSYQVGDLIINSTALSQTFSIEVTPTEGENKIVCKVSFEAGEQPLNSAGENYGSPYPAGSLTQTLVFTAVYPPYNADGEEVEFTIFKADDGSGYEVIAQSEASSGVKQSFAIPATMTVIGIKQYDIISKDWQWIGGDAESSLEVFNISTISGSIIGENIDYVLYTNNGVQQGERQLRFYVTQN